jgi:23S rRNA (uracil1939-C5)-methyltransferase
MEKLRIKLEKWVNGGYALGHHEGHAVFVTGGIPGEEADITLEKQGKKEWFGTVSEIIQPAINRIPIDCEVYKDCGGCSYRHITYADEVEIKKTLLADMFPSESRWMEILTASDLHYRNNVQWQIEEGKVGFFSKQTHSVVERAQSVCLNVDPKLLWSSSHSNFSLKSKKQTNIKLRLSGDKIVNYEKDVSIFEVNGFSLRVPENGFFQINKFLIQPWLDKISQWLPDNARVLELFCGCGTIGIGLSRKIVSLLGIEVQQKSIDFAKENSKVNGIRNFSYEALDLYQRPIPKSAEKFDIWIVNPPRAGLTSSIIDSMIKYRPTKIIYSSCNPSTLKRDVIELKKRNYKITKMVLVDFFPRTAHYEVVICMERT